MYLYSWVNKKLLISNTAISISIDKTYIYYMQKNSLRSSIIFKTVKGSWDQKFWELLRLNVSPTITECLISHWCIFWLKIISSNSLNITLLDAFFISLFSSMTAIRLSDYWSVFFYVSLVNCIFWGSTVLEFIFNLANNQG